MAAPIVPGPGHLRAILINNNAARTNNPLVDLILSAHNATEMMISNDENFVGAVWETFVTAKEWYVLDEVPGPGHGDGDKIVYVKFRSVTLEESAVHEATIYLDTTPPVVSAIPIIINNSELATDNRNVVLHFNVQGAATIEILNEIDEVSLEGTIVPYAAQVPWVLSANNGHKTILANFFDEIGNSTGYFSADIILTGQDPNSPAITSPVDGSTTTDHFITIRGTGDPESRIKVEITNS